MASTLQVNLGERSYPIHFGKDLRALIAAGHVDPLSAGRQHAVLVDETVARIHGAAIDALLGNSPRLALPAGERTKSLDVFGRALDFLAEANLGRGATLWVIGGGVIGDLGGFAAASYLRGIRYVQVPTTLLAMVDSSVGGKTGINLSTGKNLVGAFHHPSAVLIATDFLSSLPAREFAAGMAEVIKTGLLGDAALFERLEKTPLRPGAAHLEATIRRCCEMKAAVVEADERETATQGGRALLNLGHTFGHAIEQVTGFSRYLHGEAVAIGLAAAARLSCRLKLISEAEVARVETVVSAHQLPIRLAAPLEIGALMAAMQHDKKVRAGRLRFVVLERLGAAATRDDVDPELVRSVWNDIGAG
ncbi:MAG TPA: 3-dehydroquinate synthase [Candidatus Didemnitutus sp.]|nr:3-dehydroquinate synthase [Candidatus Didemnitutus sp.]